MLNRWETLRFIGRPLMTTPNRVFWTDADNAENEQTVRERKWKTHPRWLNQECTSTNHACCCSCCCLFSVRSSYLPNIVRNGRREEEALLALLAGWLDGPAKTREAFSTGCAGWVASVGNLTIATLFCLLAAVERWRPKHFRSRTPATLFGNYLYLQKGRHSLSAKIDRERQLYQIERRTKIMRHMQLFPWRNQSLCLQAHLDVISVSGLY